MGLGNAWTSDSDKRDSDKRDSDRRELAQETRFAPALSNAWVPAFIACVRPANLASTEYF